MMEADLDRLRLLTLPVGSISTTSWSRSSRDAQVCGGGWCKDRWGLNWQITPIALTRAIVHPDPAAASRAFAAMMTMRKIDIAAIEAAVRGNQPE